MPFGVKRGRCWEGVRAVVGKGEGAEEVQTASRELQVEGEAVQLQQELAEVQLASSLALSASTEGAEKQARRYRSEPLRCSTPSAFPLQWSRGMRKEARRSPRSHSSLLRGLSRD